MDGYGRYIGKRLTVVRHVMVTDSSYTSTNRLLKNF